MIEYTLQELKQLIIEQMEIETFLDILGIGDISLLVEYFQTEIELQYDDFVNHLIDEIIDNELDKDMEN